MVLRKIVGYIQGLKRFVILFWSLRFKFKVSQYDKDLLKNAKNELDDSLDVINLIKRIRKVEVLSNLLLKKHQRYFLPKIGTDLSRLMKPNEIDYGDQQLLEKNGSKLIESSLFDKKGIDWKMRKLLM